MKTEMKHQISTSRFQRTFKHPNTKALDLRGGLELEHWIFSGAWMLVLGDFLS
jgi:hypothetical protein